MFHSSGQQNTGWTRRIRASTGFQHPGPQVHSCSGKLPLAGHQENESFHWLSASWLTGTHSCYSQLLLAAPGETELTQAFSILAHRYTAVLASRVRLNQKNHSFHWLSASWPTGTQLFYPAAIVWTRRIRASIGFQHPGPQVHSCSSQQGLAEPEES